jgi:hypothetical protein
MMTHWNYEIYLIVCDEQEEPMRAPLNKPFLILGTVLIVLAATEVLASSAGVNQEWWRLSTDVEASRYSDDDPEMYDGAEGQTQSLYLSAGRGISWLALGVSHQNLDQEYLDSLMETSTWSHRATRAMFVAKPTFAAFQGHVAGFYSKGRAGWGGQGLQIGAKRWFPECRILRSIDLRMGWSKHSLDSGTSSDSWGYELQKLTQWTLSTNLTLPTQGFRTEVALLGSRRGSLSRGAVLLRLSSNPDASLTWNVDVLRGSQETWFDADRLVIHDGSRPMEGLFSLGLSQTLRGGFSLHGSTGIEIDRGHRSQWVHLGLAYRRLRWIMN